MDNTAPATAVTAAPAETGVPKSEKKNDQSIFANMGLLFKDASANASLLKSANLSPEMQMHFSMNFLMNGMKQLGLDKYFEPFIGIFKMFGMSSAEDLSTKLNGFGDVLARLDKGNSADFMAALKDELKSGKLKLANGIKEEEFIKDMTKLADTVYKDSSLSAGEAQVIQAKLADNFVPPPATSGIVTLRNHPNPTPQEKTLIENVAREARAIKEPLLESRDTYDITKATHYFMAAQTAQGPNLGEQFTAVAPNTKLSEVAVHSLAKNEELLTQAATTMRLGG